MCLCWGVVFAFCFLVIGMYLFLGFLRVFVGVIPVVCQSVIFRRRTVLFFFV